MSRNGCQLGLPGRPLIVVFLAVATCSCPAAHAQFAPAPLTTTTAQPSLLQPAVTPAQYTTAQPIVAQPLVAPPITGVSGQQGGYTVHNDVVYAPGFDPYCAPAINVTQPPAPRIGI